MLAITVAAQSVLGVDMLVINLPTVAIDLRARPAQVDTVIAFATRLSFAF